MQALSEPHSMPIYEPADVSPAPLLLRWARAWDRFWFTPADPLMLGLIRIGCGLLVLYVHIAYTYDLEAMVGENAWLDRSTAETFRQQVPWNPMYLNWQKERPRVDPPDSAEQIDFIHRYQEYWTTRPNPHLAGLPPNDPGLLAALERWEDTDPRRAYTLGNRVWSMWFHVTDPEWVWILHGCVLVICFLFTIGFCTRITAVLVWLATVSYIQRAVTSLFGMDAMMMIALLYLTIGPCGAALSVDRLITRWWATRRALREGLPLPVTLERTPRVSANVALRLFQIHFCFIYGAAGLSKLLGDSWWNGTAMWWIYANYEFAPLNQSWFSGTLKLLARHRWLWEIAIGAGTYFTLMLEIGFPFLVWNRRLRGLMVALSILLHTSIALIMGLATFSLIMVTLVISFIPAEATQRVLNRLGRGPRFRLCFNRRSSGQARAVSFVRAFDVFEQVEPSDRLAAAAEPVTEPAEANSEAIQAAPSPTDSEPAPARLTLVTSSGDVLTGYALFERLVRSLKLLWPLALVTWVPGASSVGRSWFPQTA